VGVHEEHIHRLAVELPRACEAAEAPADDDDSVRSVICHSVFIQPHGGAMISLKRRSASAYEDARGFQRSFVSTAPSGSDATLRA
jgi:hypothetical protein